MTLTKAEQSSTQTGNPEAPVLMQLHCGFAGESHAVELNVTPKQLKTLRSGGLLWCNGHGANSIGFPPQPGYNALDL